jgi:hypothetical protein
MEIGTKIALPKGDPASASPLVLEMDEIYSAERRLSDVRTANPENAVEFMGAMNVAANLASKYMAWIQYELLMAQKHYDKRKAHVILVKMPEEAEKLKERGIKVNEDIREALLTQDDECFKLRDRIDCLTAYYTIIEGKLKSFVRAFNAAKSVSDNRRASATAPIVSVGADPFRNLRNAQKQFRNVTEGEFEDE